MGRKHDCFTNFVLYWNLFNQRFVRKRKKKIQCQIVVHLWFCCSDFYTVCILHIITSVRLSNLRLSTTEYKTNSSDTWRLWQIEQQQLIAKYLYTNTLWQCLMGPMILYVFVIAIQHEPYGNMKTYYKNTIYLFFSFSAFFLGCNIWMFSLCNFCSFRLLVDMAILCLFFYNGFSAIFSGFSLHYFH